jgi:hypothetical protein
MGSNKLAIASGVIIERVGDDLVVFVPGSAETVKLTEPAADAVVAIQAGQRVDTDTAIVSDLVDLGIIEASGISRRGLITAGALGAGTAIAVLSLPTAAAASSGLNLNGRWTTDVLADNPVIRFNINDSTPGGWPTVVPSTDGTTIGPLTVNGESFAAENFSFEEGDEQFIVWDSDFPGAEESESTVFVGTFTWNATPFTVTFTAGGEA